METNTKKIARRKDRITYEEAFAINGRTPPQAVEIEEAVLGALMLDQNALNETIQMLRSEYFYRDEHQRIFKAIITLTELTSRVVSAAHIEFHARILSEKYIQREVIRICTETLTKAYDETTDVIDLLDDTERVLMDIEEKNFHTEYRDIREVYKDAMDQIKSAQESGNSFSGIPTGFHALDRMTAGFQPGTLIILAARPAMGKTAFALTMARNIAIDMQMPIAFFSLEMSAVELVMRLISSESGISGDRLKKGEKLGDVEATQLFARTEALTQAPIYIDDTPSLSIFELRAKCRRLKQQHGIRMVFIDYLQLMQGGGEMNRNGNREQEISMISRQLKALSKELGMPILALSQLSRAVETRGGSKKPQLSDLRESGAIEQDADIVMFIYRPEYYQINEDESGSTIGRADIILAKHRSGEVGEVRLKFVRQFAKFDNLEEYMGDNMTSGLQPNADFDNASPFAAYPQATQQGGVITIGSRMNEDFNSSNQENEDMF